MHVLLIKCLINIPHTRDLNIVIQLKFDKIAYGKNTLKHYSSHSWNLLPKDINKSTEITMFKNQLIRWERVKVPMYCVVT